MKVSFKEFKRLYLLNLEKIKPCITDEVQHKIAKHNIGWAPPYSFSNYLEKSCYRFYLAYLSIPSKESKCLDIGGFWGIYCATLSDLGYDCSMTETMKFYDNSFNSLFNFIKSKSIKIIDLDPFNARIEQSYDYISVMAVIEHIPNSLSYFMMNIHQSLNQDGGLFIDVPNIAYYYNRKKLMSGKSILPDVSLILKSASPFIGHHHEYTFNELKYLLSNCGFEVVRSYKFNYSLKRNLVTLLSHPIAHLAFFLLPTTREIIATFARKK